MSLNFNLSKIKDFEKACYVETSEGLRYNPITEALIFATMAVGLGQITEKNVDEFARRLDVVQGIDGCFLRGADGKPYSLTKEHVQKHIGLTTNASNWQRRTFDSKMKKAAQEKMKREAKDGAS